VERASRAEIDRAHEEALFEDEGFEHSKHATCWGYWRPCNRRVRTRVRGELRWDKCAKPEGHDGAHVAGLWWF